MALCENMILIQTKQKKDRLDYNIKNNFIYVACRKCYICQQNKRREHIQRFTDEARYYKYAFMITLTYDNKYIRFRDIETDKLLFDKEKQELIKIKSNLDKLYFDNIKKYIREFNDLTFNEKIEILKNHYKDLTIFNHIDITEQEYNTNNIKKYYADKTFEKIYYALVNKYTTLRYKDLKDYIKRVRDEIKRNKNIVDKDFKYFACGEYPAIKNNRGRGHYHIGVLTNDKEMIYTYLRAWRFGNATFGRGDNQIDLKSYDNKYIRNFDKLDLIVKLESREADIKRIRYYINNENVKVAEKNQALLIAKYIAGYVNKKREADIERYKDYKAKELKRLYDFKYSNNFDTVKEAKDKLKLIRKYEKNQRERGITTIEKEEPFICKSQGLGKRYCLNNIERFRNNPYEQKANKKILINDYYLKLVSEKYKDVIFKYNEIVSELKLDKLKDYAKRYNLKVENINDYDNDYRLQEALIKANRYYFSRKDLTFNEKQIKYFNTKKILLRDFFEIKKIELENKIFIIKNENDTIDYIFYDKDKELKYYEIQKINTKQAINTRLKREQLFNNIDKKSDTFKDEIDNNIETIDNVIYYLQNKKDIEIKTENNDIEYFESAKEYNKIEKKALFELDADFNIFNELCDKIINRINNRTN